MVWLSFLDTCGIGKYFKDKTGKFQSFLFWNAVAAFAHLGNAAFSFNGASDQGRKNMYPVFQDYAGWIKKTDFCTNNTGIGYTRGDYVILPTESAKSQELSLFWLIIGFHLLSFSFQIILNTDYFRNYYVNSVLKNGVNPFRFVEYSISASIMVICLALISNILNLYALIALGCLTAVTQLFGLLAECLFSDEFLIEELSFDKETGGNLFKKATFRQSEVQGLIKRKTQKPEKPQKTTLSTKLRRLGWVAHFSGWISMISAYVGILVQQYFFSVDQNKDNGVSPPDWVTVLIVVLAILYNIFGFTQVVQLCLKDAYMNAWTGKNEKCRFPGITSDGSGDGKKIQCCGKSLNESIELCYVINSLVTKTVLGWTIIGNLLVEDVIITTTVTC